jgi:hypothetical protein
MRIVAASPLSNFRIELSFDSGESGVVDLSSLAGRGVFKAWEQPEVFDALTVTQQGALEWPGEIDLCPDALYLRMTGKTAAEVFPRLQHPQPHA